MLNVRKIKWLLVVAIGFGLLRAQAIELIKKEDASFSLGGRFQLFGVGERVTDPYEENNRYFLFLKQARLMAAGTIEDYKFYTEWAMGGEEAVKNLNSSVSLLDFRADVPVVESVYLRLGQFKAPFGRESLTEDGSQNFSDRSINNLVGILGRDVGFAGVLQQKGFMGTIGVFTGGGRDNPERYLPEQLGAPLLVARLGYDSEGNDPYSYKTSGLKNEEVDAFSTFLNLAYMEDSKVGHSTVLNVKTTDRSLLLNPNWNPYIAKTPYSRSHVFEASFDMQKRFPVGKVNALTELECTHGEFANDFGKLQINGVRLMAAASLNPFEVAMRYSAVYPTHDFQYGGKTLTDDDPFQEVDASLTFFHRPWSRFIFEAVLHINTPVAVEPGIGAYVLAEQPDQVTVVKAPTNGYIERQYVPEAKFLYQLTF
jgi:hypothetical protein